MMSVPQNQKHVADGTCLQFAEVWVQEHNAAGSSAPRLVDSYESDAHKTHRREFNRTPNKIRRLLKRLIPFGIIAALLYAQHRGHDAVHVLPAATVISNVGQGIVTNRMTGAGTEPKFVMWGTGAGTAAVTDTTLFTETTDEARTTGTSSRVTTTVTNDTYQVVGTITVATSGKTITNVGLFDVVTASSGNLYFKSDFTGLALSVADSITFTIKVKFS